MKNDPQPLRNMQPHFTKVLVRLLFFLTIAILFFTRTNAQATKEKQDYSTNPVWIKMIDNPNTNYYEAMKAYKAYWQNHKKPAGEEEEMSEGKKDFKEMERETKREIRKDQKKKLSEEQLKKINENEMMKYQVKRFEQWAREVKPFVQEDGRILTDQERLDIWKKQQEEIKQQQK